jgi:hypothetical protein
VGDPRAERRRGQLAHAGDDAGQPRGQLEAVLDHVHLDLALRAHLAVLARQQLDPLVVVGGQRAQASPHPRGALLGAQGRPGWEGVVRRGDRAARLLLVGRGGMSDHPFRVGRVVHGVALGGVLLRAGDVQPGSDLRAGNGLGHCALRYRRCAEP